MSATTRLRGLWNMTRFYMAQKKAARDMKRAAKERKKEFGDLLPPRVCAQRGCKFNAKSAPDVCPVCGNPFIEARQ